MKKVFGRLFKEEEGQGLSEYGLILAGVVVVAITVVALLKTEIADVFNKVKTELDKAG